MDDETDAAGDDALPPLFRPGDGDSSDDSDDEEPDLDEGAVEDEDSSRRNMSSSSSQSSSMFDSSSAGSSMSDCSSVGSSLEDSTSSSSESMLSESSSSSSSADSDGVDDVNGLLHILDNILNASNDPWDHRRIDWEDHVAMLMNAGLFENEYRMTHGTFCKLRDILSPHLQRAEHNSRSSEPITPTHIMVAGLRVLYGGRTIDQSRIVGTGRTAAYDAVDDFIDAVNSASELDIRRPYTPEEWARINRGFRSKSFQEMLHGCVGALDGFFQRTNQPTRKETKNVTSYYSGHYESYGVNCQAIAASDLRFLHFSVCAPGSTYDNVAFDHDEDLKSLVYSLPRGLYVVADAAYTLTESVLVPFTGAHRFDSASSLRLLERHQPEMLLSSTSVPTESAAQLITLRGSVENLDS